MFNKYLTSIKFNLLSSYRVIEVALTGNHLERKYK